jgi:hypothetical protein
MLIRSAAISMPGVILSQLEMHTIASAQCALIFDAVRDQIPARQAVKHTPVTHCDAVIHRNGVEFLGDTARRFDLARDELAQVIQVDMAGHKLGEAVDDCDDRLAEVLVLHTGGAPEAAGAGHVTAVGGGVGAISGHEQSRSWFRVSPIWISIGCKISYWRSIRSQEI